ncbi:hypothetical protein AQJ11_29960 [Streptomyces corchorusii]|uniref:Uncharacterized protein n=1 Tax=Streptomyces corchorusii TaxID=1903 RepID=A0A101PZ93_STRCK|nr:hypothetical protein AQJ11_29960 [Streptomyces corchorusii]
MAQKSAYAAQCGPVHTGPRAVPSSQGHLGHGLSAPGDLQHTDGGIAGMDSDAEGLGRVAGKFGSERDGPAVSRPRALVADHLAVHQ